MSWMSDDHPDHEGYFAALFADGATAVSDSSAGITAMHPRTGERTLRTGADVVGWQVRCDHSRGAVTWFGPSWTRVATPDEHDLSQRRIFTDDDANAMWVEDRDEALELAVNADWHAHVDPMAAREAVRDAYGLVVTSQQGLNERVAAAREAGVSWADIGLDTHMTRQSAHGRWGPITDAPTT